MQVWTDFPSSSAVGGQHGSGSGSDDSEGASISASFMSTTSRSSRNSSPVASGMVSAKEFSTLTTRLERDVNYSKLFIFLQNSVCVVSISDRISLLRPHKGGFLHSKPQQRARMRLVPSKKSGSYAIRVRTLRGTRGTPAGIPLDGGGLRHAEQERAEGFEDSQSIEAEVDSEKVYLTDPSFFIAALNSEDVEVVANPAIHPDASKSLAPFKQCVAERQLRCDTSRFPEGEED